MADLVDRYQPVLVWFRHGHGHIDGEAPNTTAFERSELEAPIGTGTA
jgi:hypothetical protein